MPDAVPRPRIDQLVEQARAGLDRVEPTELEAELAAGALVVDTRPAEQRARDGALPGALVIDRNVLEWRLDPTSPHRIAQAGDPHRRVIVVCDQGYSSSLAAATLRRLGLDRATDLVGGFQAWRRAQIRVVYDAGATSYAEHWAPALHRHARDLARLVPAPLPGAGRTVLDVAAGAGTLLPELRPLAGAGPLVALDYSAGMLALAGDAVPRVQADAASLPVADRCADVAVYAFVLFLLPDARRAVAEAARVVRPGGWVLAATWGAQLGTGADVVVREELDAAGAPRFPDLPRSDELTDSPERMADLLAAGGFTDVRTMSRPLDARFDAESALAMRTGSGNLGWRFARLPADVRVDVLRRAAARLAALPDEAFVDRSEVLLTVARRGDG